MDHVEHMEPSVGEVSQIVQIFQAPNIALAHYLMGLKIRALSVVDGSSVDSDTLWSPVVNEPFGSFRVKPRKVKIFDIIFSNLSTYSLALSALSM